MVTYIRDARPTFSIAIASAVGVAERWSQQYPPENWPGAKQDIAKKVRELGDRANPDEVAKAIGNESWTHPHCDSCGTYVKRAVAYANGDRDFMVCEPCIIAAMAALTSTHGENR
jgi:hypothetical protein